MNLPAYPKYKDSGVAWLGMVPEGWEVKRLGHMARLKSGEAITSEEMADGGSYPVYGGNGVRGSFAEYTHEGDYILIGRQGALCGNISRAYGKFWASEHAIVVTPSHGYCIPWSGYLLEAMNLNQYSVAAAQPGLAVNTIAALIVPFPPLPEQQAIAAFLDRETAQLNALVEKQRRMLDLLKEKRTALISHAVTKGLNPDAKLKDSGVAWLGMVPEGWEVKRLRHLLSTPLQYGANEAAEYDLPEWPRYIRITDVTENGELRPETFRSLPEEVAEKYLLSYGDVLFARSGATVGKTFLYKSSWGTCAYAGYLIRAKIFLSRALPEFIKYFTESTCYWQWVASVQIQATIQNISAEKYGDMSFPLPPLPEQQAIAAFLDHETAKIDTLAARMEDMIAKLQEYRTALITAAVTGKIDVQNM